MKVSICYFSGTGNTLKVAETLKCELASLGTEVEMLSIEKKEKYLSSDALVIAYPVWGFGAPKVVTDYVKALKEDVVKAYFLKTSGEPLSLNDASSIELAKILTKKGYMVSGEYHFIMPYNMVFRHTDELASKMFKTAKERMSSVSSEIRNGRVKPILYPLRARVMHAICGIEHVGMKLNGNLYTVNKKRCINCNRCVNDCPQKNITIKDGKFHFGPSCIGCARCAFCCPTDAINTGILNFLKVNGKYDFSSDDTLATLPKYCKKSYKQYFKLEN